MAIDFLSKSPKYLRKVSAKIRLRRSIVCNHLNENYKFARNKSDQIRSDIRRELSSHGIEAGDATISKDCQIYRTAFLFLQAPADQKIAVAESKRKTGPSSCIGVNCLIADKIYSFDDLAGTKTQPETSFADAGNLSIDEILPEEQSTRKEADSFEVISAELEKIRARSFFLEDKISDLESEVYSLTQEKRELE